MVKRWVLGQVADCDRVLFSSYVRVKISLAMLLTFQKVNVLSDVQIVTYLQHISCITKKYFYQLDSTRMLP